ncbi:MAG TPA: hypothetical protein VMR20_14655, partial [Verrucomicrobiae bacterium]|nr:hypothetical protein [Verrucomicrobiae bacterium]
SEYQYYEFKALDELLTQAQISRLRGYSSRGPITPEGQTGTGCFSGSRDLARSLFALIPGRRRKRVR